MLTADLAPIALMQFFDYFFSLTLKSSRKNDKLTVKRIPELNTESNLEFQI